MSLADLDPIAEPVPITRRQRRKLEVRQRILDASRELFEQKGIDATTVVEICALADVAEKTFFNHFTSKKQMLQAFAAVGLANLVEWIEVSRARPGSTRDRLIHFFDHLARMTAEGGPAHRELLADIVAVSHEAGDETAQARLLHDAFGGFVTDGIALGDVDPLPGVETLTEMLVGAYYALTFNWAYLPDYPLRERAVASARFLADSMNRSSKERER